MSRHIHKQVQAAHAEAAFWRDFVESAAECYEPAIQARLGRVRNLAESKLETLRHIACAYAESDGKVCGVANTVDQTEPRQPPPGVTPEDSK